MWGLIFINNSTKKHFNVYILFIHIKGHYGTKLKPIHMENLIFNVRPTLRALRKGYEACNLKYNKNKQPFVIKRNTSSKVRLNLKWDDIYNDTLLEQGFADEVFFKRKKIYLFSEPYYVPDFSQYYAKKVENPDNGYLEELIFGLLFLNPNPDHLMKLKITECILQKFTEHHKVKSKVKEGEFVYVPILIFDEVLEMVKYLSIIKILQKIYTPPHSKTVMYGANYISKEDKIAFRSALRRQGDRKYYKKAISEAINELIKNEPDVKISYGRLESINMIKKFNTNKYASAKLIRSVLSDSNKRIINKHNETAHFSKVKQKEKFNKLVFMDSPTLDEIVKHCKVSKRDAMRFKKLKQIL